jgi:lipoprotein-releasing system ATP-binding protein
MITAQGIHKVYHNGSKQIPVLKGVNVSITRGALTAIVGPSGAGKSTLLHILGGLDAPSAGAVLFEGSNLYRMPDAALSRIRNEQIGFVFQFYHLLPEFSVLENVMMPALIGDKQKRRGERLDTRALELLRRVGLEQRTAHFPSQLSGGEKQRVAIARALINSPALLLCDEPTGNLDSATGSEIVSLIKEIHHTQSMTVIIVTHNMEIAGSCSAIHHLRDGVLVD